MKAGFLQMEPKLGEGPQNALHIRELIGKMDRFESIQTYIIFFLKDNQ